MGSTWDHMGEIANIAQLTGLDAVRLIGMIVKAANTARMHKTNCRQFAQHLKLIGNLLEQLRISEMKKYRETREPLELLEDALRRSYILVNSCQDRSYFYLLAMGWNIVYQFRKAQDEIDRYLKIIPLITLVDNSRVRERLEDIERDQHEYTMDDEDAKMQNLISKQDPSDNDAMLLKKSLSTSYPNMPFNEALKKENEKLRIELQRSQANCDVGQCEVIHHLLDVTEAVASKKKNDSPKKVDDDHDIADIEDSCNETYITKEKTIIHTRSLDRDEEWSTDLLGCCSEPLLCLETLFCPCGTFAKIASAATNKNITTSEACNELMAYTLILSCCCYTCCMRRKLRKTFNIAGGLIDDFLTHLMCCCCALVQEYREVEIQNGSGPEKTKTRPPHSQYMES